MSGIVLRHVFKLLRPKHWAKNLFIFLPVFFGGQLFNLSALLGCLVAFVAFSFIASSIYCFNDIHDAEADRLHPRKSQRPVASGLISKKTAYSIMAACFVMSILVILFFGGRTAYEQIALILLYFIMNIAYCIKLKRYAIVDVVIISMGFVLRVALGGQASEIGASEWIMIMTFLLALFLAFAKRRDDVVLFQNTGITVRMNTDKYNLEFINQVITIIATITVVAYIMYTLSADVIERFDSNNVYITAIFVLMGIVRYLQITIVSQKSGNPIKILFCDRFIQFCIAGWIVLFLFIIYY